MDASWMVTAGRLGLYAYYLLIVTLLMGIVLRHAPRRGGLQSETVARFSADQARPHRAGRWPGLLRRAIEYVGNLDLQVLDRKEQERRRNLQARILMEHIKEDLARRDIPHGEKEELVENLRESIQSAGLDQAG